MDAVPGVLAQSVLGPKALHEALQLEPASTASHGVVFARSVLYCIGVCDSLLKSVDVPDRFLQVFGKSSGPFVQRFRICFPPGPPIICFLEVCLRLWHSLLKQPLAAACSCSHLQPLAATCSSSHLLEQPLAPTCSCSRVEPHAATCSHMRT